MEQCFCGGGCIRRECDAHIALTRVPCNSIINFRNCVCAPEYWHLSRVLTGLEKWPCGQRRRYVLDFIDHLCAKIAETRGDGRDGVGLDGRAGVCNPELVGIVAGGMERLLAGRCGTRFPRFHLNCSMRRRRFWTHFAEYSRAEFADVVAICAYACGADSIAGGCGGDLRYEGEAPDVRG